MKVKIKFSKLRELVDKSINLDDLKEKYDTLSNHHNSLVNATENISNLIQEIKELNEENNILSAENNKLKTLSESKMPKFWYGDKVYKKGIGWFTIDKIWLSKEFLYSGDGVNYYSEKTLTKQEE